MTTTRTTTATTFFEISGPDPGALRRFYAEALGLPVGEPDGTGYAMVAPGDGGIGGAIWDGTATFGTYAVPYVEVADLDAAVARATLAGARVLVAPTAHGPARVAHLADPAGNRIGVFEWPRPPAG